MQASPRDVPRLRNTLARTRRAPLKPTMERASRPTIRRWLLLAAALFVLNAAMTLQNVWPTLWVTIRTELSIELALLVLVLAWYAEIAARLAWPPPGRRTTLVLAVLLFVLAVGRYADVTAPALYGRPVNLYWDAQHLPRVAAMLAEVAHPWIIGAVALGVVAFVVVIGALLYGSLALVSRGLRADAPRRALGVLALVVVGSYLLGAAFDWPTRHLFSLPVAATYKQQIAFIVEARAADTARELPVEPLPHSDLEQVAGANVLLMFLESYGAITYDVPEVSAIVAPARAELAATLAATGREAASAFVESPTFGGSSWLAHSTLLSGFEVREPGTYDLLLTQKRDTLPALFAASGYRAIGLMPGMRNPWPEGAFYGFDRILGEKDLDYRGPAFGWWRIPDQYSLAKLDELAFDTGERAPAFVFFPTVNTHIPFRPTPPYQPDWQRVLTAHPFDDADTAASLAQSPDWMSLGVPYAESFAYTLRIVGGYLRTHPDADIVLVLVGDHQPPSGVTGPGARWDVPVHVIASRSAVVAALLDAGFVAGVELAPQQPAVGSMGDLTGLLLQAFSSAGSTPAYGSGRDSVRAR